MLLLCGVSLVDQHHESLVIISASDHLVLRQLQHVLEDGGWDPETAVWRGNFMDACPRTYLLR